MSRLAVSLLLSVAAAAGPPGQQPLVPSVTVVGVGKATAQPDTAQVQVGVISQAPSAAQALKDNNEAMSKLFRVLEAAGIAKKDVQTSNFSVVPQYKRGPHNEQLPDIVAYRVANEVRVRVRQLGSLGRVLDEVVAQGANQVQGVSSAVADPAPLLDEARRGAMADAHHRADLYAKAAGVRLGRVLLIQEQTPRLPVPQFFGLARGAGAVPVAPGEQEVQASVTVTYAMGTPDKQGKSPRRRQKRRGQ
jgi:uncharacterized protein YggE